MLKLKYSAAALLLAFGIPGFSQNFNGAIQTTLGAGTTVNANQYPTKEDVHLTGGPQNTSSKGLPDGYYYFQVTNPSGSVLLSADPLNCRQVQVVQGVIAHSFDGVNYDGAGCSHQLGSGLAPNQSKPVQLYPYDTQNQGGGVYKVWLFAQAGIAGCAAPTADPVTGLLSGCSKTDNFKVGADSVTPQWTLSGVKYNDLAVNGTRDPGDPLLPDWEIVVTGTKLGAPLTISVFTDSLGAWTGPSLDQGTTFTACEVLQTGYAQSGPIAGASPQAGITATSTGVAPQGPVCWSGTIPTADATGLDFGNYAQLVVSKTAVPAFTRTYNWSISKNVDKTSVTLAGGTATFNYTVDVNQTGFTDSAWSVSGVITVNNPNAGSVTATITDSIDNGGTCAVTGGAAATLLPGNNTFNYTCTYAAQPSPTSGSNTATATWSGGSPTGTAAYAFGAPTTAVNKTVNVTDSMQGSLGSVTATDATPYTSTSFTYAKSFQVQATAGCVSYDNTATITETGQSASQSVQVCRIILVGGRTMGFWQNRNGQRMITSGAATSGDCNSAAYLRTFAPFSDLTAPTTCAQVASYFLGVFNAASAAGDSMNAMLKAQMLATALSVFFSDPANGNPLAADAPIGGLTMDLTKICSDFTFCSTTKDVSAAFDGATSMTVSEMLTHAASQSDPTGFPNWYANDKSIQGLAKDAFDSINNGAIALP
jgi:hypothetical protein